MDFLLFFAHVFVGFQHHILINTETQRDIKGVASAGDPHQQTVGGTQGIHIKFHAGVGQTGVVIGIGLQFAVMRRYDGLYPFGHQRIDNGHGKGSAFHRIRSRAELIQKHKIVPSRLGENIHNIDHMGRERTQGLFNALLVADIGVHAAEYGNTAPIRSRQMQTGLRHQHEKTCDFQRYGLPAGIGAGHDDPPKLAVHIQIDGNGFFAQQRMTRFFQMDFTVFIEDRLKTVHFQTEFPLGENKVQFSHDLKIGFDLRGISTDQTGKTGQNAMDFRFFLTAQFSEIVVQVKNRHGLDKQRSAAGALVVNETGHLIAVLLLYGNNIAVIAYGDDIFLQILILIGIFQQVIQFFTDAVVGTADLAADIRQFGRCAVQNFTVFADGFLNGAFQRIDKDDAAGQSFDDRIILFCLGKRCFQPFPGL